MAVGNALSLLCCTSDNCRIVLTSISKSSILASCQWMYTKSIGGWYKTREISNTDTDQEKKISNVQAHITSPILWGYLLLVISRTWLHLRLWTRCRNALWCTTGLISRRRRNVPFLLFAVYLFDAYTFPYEGAMCVDSCEQLVQVEE